MLQLLVQVTSNSGEKSACCDLDLGPADLLSAAGSQIAKYQYSMYTYVEFPNEDVAAN